MSKTQDPEIIADALDDMRDDAANLEADTWHEVQWTESIVLHFRPLAPTWRIIESRFRGLIPIYTVQRLEFATYVQGVYTPVWKSVRSTSSLFLAIAHVEHHGALC